MTTREKIAHLIDEAQTALAADELGVTVDELELVRACIDVAGTLLVMAGVSPADWQAAMVVLNDGIGRAAREVPA